MKKRKMFFKLILRSLNGRKSRVLIALLAITIGNLVVAGLISVYSGLDENMSREMRGYGANVILTPSVETDSFITREQMEQANQYIPSQQLIGYSPILYGKGEINGKETDVVGINLRQMLSVAPYWRVDGEENSLSPRQVMVGVSLAETERIRIGDSIKIKINGNYEADSYQVVGVISTGGTEDEQMFINLSELQKQMNLSNKYHYILYSIVADENVLDQVVKEIEGKIKGINVTPVKQIVQSEGKVLAKMISLVTFIVVLILGSTFLCVLSTLIAMVTERKKEIGLKKALGASEKAIAREFLSESILIACMGSLLGWGLGWFFAQWVANTVFQTEVTYQLYSLPIVLLLSFIIVLGAAWIPLKRLSQVNPAVVLKGE
ncbi:FtsX-like permease family protein [Microaerobacter geothermalis]|uniref:ABC transporter permease n=1 Tax=Microaerobacter geothermalis TaxID=674972 RepID=UPI001F342FDA|nr:FtsX-like permease family protein [Microaerobacter geothermalis]MCF6094404.1 FtsX-like permease family protein [Microaerobacter geothermalis]